MDIEVKSDESFERTKTRRGSAVLGWVRRKRAGVASASLLVVVAWLGGCAGELEGESFPNAYTGGTSAGGAGAGGAAGTPAAGAATGGVPALDACVTTVFMTHCTVCHNASSASLFGNLDLTGADVGTRLADRAASAVTPPCAVDGKVINTANPAQSVLIQRIKGTQPAGCGTIMPATGAIPMPDQMCVEAWINKF